MPEQVIESFEVERLRILNEKGEADSSLMPSFSPDEIKKMYGLLVLSRIFDERALSLQGEGRLGTYASFRGQEASQVGSALAFDPSDWIFPSYRESAVFISRGYPLDRLYQFWSGDERGMRVPDGLNILPISIPVSTHILHATGAAMAAKIKKEKTAAAAYFGDGATSKGDFHEGLNFAGVYNAPVVFICQNNQWAISLPRERQTASRTIAQKALAYGFAGIQVDGNDVFAVYKATKDALEKAKEGGGPTLIECYTYRMGHHTTADDSTRYRIAEEVESWKEKDPILRLARYMEKNGLLNEESKKSIAEEAGKKIDEAVSGAESMPPPDLEEMFTYTYHSLSHRERKEMREISDGPG